MAEQDALDADPVKPKRSKLKWALIILLITLLSSVLALAVTYFFLWDRLMADPQDEPLPPLIYVPLGSAMVSNIEGPGRIRYVQLGVTVATRHPQVPTLVEEHLPVIRNSIIMLLSGKHYDDLITAEGKETVRVQILQTVRELLHERIELEALDEIDNLEDAAMSEDTAMSEDADEQDTLDVEDQRVIHSLYFTTFVMQ
jgi:flagellar FliL protein